MKAADRVVAIKERARELGFDLVGITSAAPPPHSTQFEQWLAQAYPGEMGYMERNARKRTTPNELLPDARSIVVVAANYYSCTGIPACTGSSAAAGRDACATQPRIARYAWGTRDYHEVLGEKLQQLAAFIRSFPGPGTQTLGHSGTQAPASSDTQALWYVDTGPILERDLAQRAGVGFIGKHTNLISRELGNWVFLGEILTNLELPPDVSEREYCGTCRRCIDVCPTRAIVAPYTLDARLCISYLTIELKGSIPVELRPLIGDRIFGCDDCLEVCPWNRFAKISPVKEIQRRETPPLVQFLSWDEAKFREFFRGTPIYRIKRRRFLRNVCVALGNVGDASTLPSLERALDDAEPLVREHAAWAMERIHTRLTEGSRRA